MNLDMNSDCSGLCTDMLGGMSSTLAIFCDPFLLWQNRLIRQVNWSVGCSRDHWWMQVDLERDKILKLPVSHPKLIFKKKQ